MAKMQAMGVLSRMNYIQGGIVVQYQFLNFNIFQNQTKYKDITNIELITKTITLAC
jgi:hypothetical protein